MLTHTPVYIDFATPHCCAVVVDLFHQLVWCHTRGYGRQPRRQTLPFSQRNGGVASVSPLLSQERRPIDRVFALEIGENRVDSVLASVHRSTVSLHHLITQLGTQTLGRQLVGIQFARTRVCADFLVHQRLGQTRRVLLVVTQLAEAGDVYDHILAKLHAEFQGQLSGKHHRFRIIAIHVQDRRLHHLHDIGTKRARAHIARIGCSKTDLIIDDDVHRAAGGVSTGLA